MTDKNENENAGVGQNDEPETRASAWELDKLYGLRIDSAFAVTDEQPSKKFLVLGAKSDGVIETVLGDAEHVSLLVQELDEKGRATGMPFKVGTLASAIVEKMKAAAPGDFPAICQLMKVDSKFGKKALVIQHVGETDPSSLLDEFAVAGDTLAKVPGAADIFPGSGA